MTRVSKTLAATMGLFLWTGPAIASDEVEAELAEMRRLVEGLQQKVDAQEEQLSAQGRNLEEAQRVVRRTQEETEAVSGLANFLNSIEVDGHVAVSYAYNPTGDPDSNNSATGAVQPGGSNPVAGGLAQGASGAFYPFHGDTDTFSVDQIWFGLGKPATEESRAGFRFDIVYGNTATFLGNGSPTLSRGLTLDAVNDFYINQAYIEYLAPIANGVTVTAGKFGTLVGAEVAQTTANFNITRGNVYNLLQPIDHVGMLVSTDIGPVGVTVGAANSQTLGVGTLDDNTQKTLITQLGMGDDKLSGNATVIWGAEAGSNKDDLGLLDFVITANPTDALSVWLNVDYVWSSGNAAGLASGVPNGDAWGIAAAGRYAMTDRMGVALRAEFVQDSSGRLGITQANRGAASAVDDNQVWGLTATVDYTLVENLLMRLESRYDRVNHSGEFFNRNGLDRDQWVLLAEAVYTF